MKIKVKDNPDLVQEVGSGAIINTNKEEIRAARARKKARLEERNRIDSLEKDVGEIKALLKELIGKL